MESLKSSKRVRAQKLKNLRKLTGLSRRDFSIKHKIAPGTLQNWEDARNGGLTEKGAKRAIQAFTTEGIQLTLEWLMHDFGFPPQISNRLYFGDLTESNEPQDSSPKTTETSSAHHIAAPPVSDAKGFSAIVQELLLFQKLNPNSIDAVIADNGMTPRFIVGEQVAGIQRIGKDIVQAIHMDCILQTTHGDVLVRHLRVGSEPNRYNLVCTNPHADVAKPVLYDVELYAAAPIIWARRTNPT